MNIIQKIEKDFIKFNKFPTEFINKIKNNEEFINKVTQFINKIEEIGQKKRFSPLNLVKLYYFDIDNNIINPEDCSNCLNKEIINWKCIDCNRIWSCIPNNFVGCIDCNKLQFNIKTSITKPNEIEYIGTKIFLNLLNKDGRFEFNKDLWEGTNADLLIRFKNSKNENYYGIQIKTCSIPVNKKEINKTYRFRDTDKYNGLIIICICIKDETIFIIPGNNLDGIKRISLKKKSKYFVKNEDCINKLVYYINNLDLHFKEFNFWDIPKSLRQKIERDFYYLHKPYFQKYKLQRPEIEHTEVDSFVIVNNVIITFQNKVCGTIKNQVIEFSFRKKGGYWNKKVTYRPYKFDEFDTLFVHINNEKYKKLIYLLPMPELIKKLKAVKYKNNKGITGLRLNLSGKKPNKIKNKINKWDCNNYLFDLEKENDINRINNLLEKISEFKKLNYIEDYPVVNDVIEYYGPKTLNDYLAVNLQLDTQFQNL